MRLHVGFSVVECMVYCFLLCTLCVLMFDWVGASHVSLAKIQNKSRNTLEIYAALDSFTRDALSAPCQTIAWKKISDTELIWQAPEGSVGWMWDGASLYRYSGEYDGLQWRHANKSLASNRLTHVAFVVHKNKHDEVVRIVSNFEKMTRSIALPNRSRYGMA